MNDQTCSSFAGVDGEIIPVWSRRRVVGALIDLIYMSVFAVVASFFTFLAYLSITGNDFDGPPGADTLGECFAWGCLSFFAVLYGLSEVLFFTTLGKVGCELRIESATGSRLPRSRSLIRWIIKWLPLLLICAGSWSAYNILSFNLETSEFDQLYGFWWWLTVGLACGAALLHVLFAILGRAVMLHDRVAGTLVIGRPGSERATGRPRGFEPILAAVSGDDDRRADPPPARD